MAWLTVTRIAGDPARLRADLRATAATMEEVGREHGLLVHAAAATDDGLLLVNIWPSPAGSSAAADPRRLKVLELHGLRPADLRREHHELAELVLAGEAPALA